MRKITQDAFRAFIEGRPMRRTGNGHTVVECCPDGSRFLYLHANAIAKYDPADGSVSITTCGWNTVTTRERLRPFAYVSTVRGDLFLGAKLWEGDWERVGAIVEGAAGPTYEPDQAE